ncbi:MAG: hypothetical protein IKB38_08610 [Clostridia bacterium]|nr:hypothetical protein [Clostridia bacterium]
MKSIFSLALAALILFSFVACGDGEDADMSYRHTYCEIALDLPTSYVEVESDSYDALFTSGEAYVGISRLSFAGIENDDLDGSMFPDTVARKYAQSNGLDVEISDKDEYSYFVYNDSGYYNLIAFYRSKYAHFIVRFVCIEEKTDKFSSDFLRYAAGAKFTQ